MKVEARVITVKHVKDDRSSFGESEGLGDPLVHIECLCPEMASTWSKFWFQEASKISEQENRHSCI